MLFSNKCSIIKVILKILMKLKNLGQLFGFKKNSLIIDAILVVVLILILSWSSIIQLMPWNRIVANKLTGTVMKIEENSISISGGFVVSKNADQYNSVEKEFIVKVNEKTKFKKVKLFLPEKDFYYVDDLQREEISGSLAELTEKYRSFWAITAISNKNIFNKDTFTATEIEYIEPIYPPSVQNQ